MKIISKLSLSAFMLAIAVSSCTVEKRVHLPGYHVEWRNSGSKVAVNVPVEQTEECAGKTEKIESGNTSMVENTVGDYPQNCTDSTSGNPVAASTGTLPEKNMHTPVLSEKVTAGPTQSGFEKRVQKRRSAKVFVKNSIQKITVGPDSETAETNEGGLLKLLGWILIVIGLAILLLFSYWIGALTMLLGLVFVLAGASI